MDVTVNRPALADALASAARAIATRAVSVSDSTVWLSADQQTSSLHVAADGPDHCVRRRIPAEIRAAGSGWFPARLLHDIATHLAGNDVELNDTGQAAAGSALAVTAQSCRFRVPRVRLADPPAQALQVGELLGVVPTAALAEAVTAVNTAAARAGQGLVVLTGVCVVPTEEQLTLVATDRYRLVVRRLNWLQQPTASNGPVNSQPVVVPATTLVDAMRDLAGEAEVALHLPATGDASSAAQLSLVGEHAAVHARLLADPFPDWKGLLPAAGTPAGTTVAVDAAGLEETLSRVTVVGQVFTLDAHPSGSLTVTVKEDSAIGEAHEGVVADVAGAAVASSYNLTYIRDAIAAVGQPRVRLSVYGPRRPLLLTDDDTTDLESASTVGLVMPVMLKS